MTSKSLNLQGEDSIVLWGDLASTVRVYFSHWVTANQSRIVLSTQFHSVMGHFFSPSLGHWLVWQGLKGCQSHIMQSTDAKPREIFQTSVLEWVFHHHHSGDVFHPDCFFLFLNTLYLNILHVSQNGSISLLLCHVAFCLNHGGWAGLMWCFLFTRCS